MLVVILLATESEYMGCNEATFSQLNLVKMNVEHDVTASRVTLSLVPPQKYP